METRNKTNLQRVQELANAGVRLTDGHKYILQNGSVMKRGVTSLVSKQFREFNAPVVAKWLSRNSEEYEGMIAENVIEYWGGIRDEGSNIHKEIDNELSGGKKASHPRAKHGIAWLKHNLKDYEFFTEIKVWSEKWSVGGSIDLLGVSANGRVLMIDWKCGKSEPTYKRKGYGITPAFKKVPDSKCSKYSAQLSLYLLLLEEFGIKVKSSHIVWLGDEGAKALPVEDYRIAWVEYLETNSPLFCKWTEGRGDSPDNSPACYQDGERNRQWTMHYADGQEEEGPYVNGKQHGQWTLRKADGTVKTVNFVDGKLK